MTIKEIEIKSAPIFKKYGVAQAMLFGSYARQEQREGSDVDILIKYAESADKSLFNLLELKHELEDALNIRVDIGTVLKPHVDISKDFIEIYPCLLSR